MAMHDPRMKHLKEKEGLKGNGAYWFIIEKLALLPEPCAGLEYLQPFCDRQIRISYLRKIIYEYQLFSIDAEGNFTPEELNPIKKKNEKEAGSFRNLPNGATENDGKQPKTAGKRPESNGKRPENVLKKLKMDDSVSSNPLDFSLLRENTPDTNKENIKDITTAATEEKEETAADAAHFPSDSSAAGTTPPPPAGTTPPPPAGATDCDEWGNRQQPLTPVKPWLKLVDGMPNNRLWMEMACMRSGYASLLIHHLPEAIAYFKRHIELYCKGDRLLTAEDSCIYFVNFVNAGGRTSQALRSYLLEIESKEKAALHDLHPDPYRYEQTAGGRRTYLGCPIPDDAPPRPDENAIWNEEMHLWIPVRKGKPKAC